MPAAPYIMATGASVANSTTVTVPIVNSSNYGDTIVLCASVNVASATLTATDTKGNTYISEVSENVQFCPTVFLAPNNPNQLTAGIDSVTVTTNSAASIVVAVAGIPGLAGSPVDQTQSANNAGSASPSVTTGTLSQSNEVAVGFIVNGSGGGAMTWAGGWNQFFPSAQAVGDGWMNMAWQDTNSTSAVTASGTLTSSSNWGAVVITLKLATYNITNVVKGNVSNDYGLDSVPYTINTPGPNTALLAYAGWSVVQNTNASSGFAPAVNVTDSAGNLWRQIGISTVSSLSRAAIWIADNPRQTSWVSVSLTGWASSTAYMICELDGLVSSFQAISIDFVKTINNPSPATTLTLSATPTVTDTVFGIVSTGGNGGSLNVPAQFTGINSVGGSFASDTTTYAMWIPTTSASLTFNPTWANSVPSSGIIVGLKQVATPPTQFNSNFPRIVVEAAFGATPGDWTQSVDYTWDIQGLTWTDISSRVFGKGDESNITTKRGRQYELSQEETGTIEIRLDNHDGAFTQGNTASTYYPNVIPGVPVRVTAWWENIQYPVAFGYVEKWPQEWPDMPQWGFSTLAAVDAWGVLANNALPSAVEGDIRKDYPYFYFPTDEEYEFTNQSLSPVASPLDANGLIAVNKAPGNQRYGAYRDGTDQPVTVGQALNLLGDQDTTLGATTYGATEQGANGPGMFYFDPNIPTNSNSGSFSVEFWFVWGNTNAFSCNLMSAWGRPSNWFGTQAMTSITNGGAIAVGVNTGINDSGTVLSGFYVNGTEVTSGQFNQTTFAPQHFVLTTGPNGTTCYLNGSTTAVSPQLPTIPQFRAASLGPARFSYDVSDLTVYNGFNYIAGHFAWYGHELTATQVSNHFSSGFDGFVGTPAPGRYAQVLTWGRMGLKRGGTAWFQTYGVTEGTYISEAYSYESSNASDIMNQLVQTEGGRAYSQANGSIVYQYRWQFYNNNTVATFGDNGTSELPFDQATGFSLDNQFIFNQITATQTRGPNNDFYVFSTNFPSQQQYFVRSGLNLSSYSLTPFDTFDVVNWNGVKYNQPVQRVMEIKIDLGKSTGRNPTLIQTCLALELNQTVTVNRRPIGGAVISVTGAIQDISHEIGPTFWTMSLQIAPIFPEDAALFMDKANQNSPNSQYLSW